MKVSVRSSNYVTEGANYERRYDALMIGDNRLMVTAFDDVKLIKPMIKEAISKGFTKTEKLPKLVQFDEYIEINV